MGVRREIPPWNILPRQIPVGFPRVTFWGPVLTHGRYGKACCLNNSRLHLCVFECLWHAFDVLQTVSRSLSVAECSICFGPLNNGAVRTLRCSHEFHQTCIRQWLQVLSVAFYSSSVVRCTAGFWHSLSCGCLAQ